MRKHSLQYYRFVFLTGIIVAVSLATSGSRTFLFAQEQSSDLNIVYSPKLYEGLDYRMIGPYRGGRVTAVTGVPGNPPTLYFGGTGGGIWKTTNNGRNYQNVSDKYFKVGSIGAISVSKSDPNVIYVGTGSACIRSNVSTGRGVYKSTDDGETWNFIGLPEAGQIGKMVVHPEDPNLVYVAALGHAFGQNSERGVYRSKDGGETWKQVLFVSDR
ncbi:MAG: WD40/YVTN/BNR-like repeat-containing protein, partial [Candidatus Poribacteria bacterium]